MLVCLLLMLVLSHGIGLGKGGRNVNKQTKRVLPFDKGGRVVHVSAMGM